MYSLRQQLTAEFIGTAFLLATVVGSGIMAEQLASNNQALALLGNTLPTGAILIVLITALGPISGAHFNPAVTLVFLLRRELRIPHAAMYILTQISAALLGVLIAHAMFKQPLFQISTNIRSGLAQQLSEGVATFGLIFSILVSLKVKPDAVATVVGLYITAAYWFTASTSFANPAVTITRGFTNTFSGIQPTDIIRFIVAQLVGAAIAALVIHWLLVEDVVN